MERKLISELCEQVIEQMGLHGYNKSHVAGHIKIYGRLLDYAKRRNITEYDEEVGKSFLRDEFGVQTKEERKKLRPVDMCAPSAINKINGWYYHGCFYHKSRPRNDMAEWAADDFDMVEGYRSSIRMTDMKDTTKHDLLRYIKAFYYYLKSIGLTTVKSVTADVLSRYVLSMQADSPVFMQIKLQTLRRYFRYLHTHKFLSEDWSKAVPRMTVTRNVKVPKIWNKEDVKALLESIDRASPIGKRAYAIILLSAELGLRAIDIEELKLANLNFQRKEIAVTQRKTGALNVCPMSSDLGWALIDYIQHGRIKSNLPFVFLTSHPPYKQMSSSAITSVLQCQMRLIGMPTSDSYTTTGIHSLRHSLAHRLLDENTPAELISGIMGHTDIASSSTYLKGDINGLRECALSLGGVL
jgi:site-specific recombinase XerD